jgi:hypothetical protein
MGNGVKIEVNDKVDLHHPTLEEAKQGNETSWTDWMIRVVLPDGGTVILFDLYWSLKPLTAICMGHNRSVYRGGHEPAAKIAEFLHAWHPQWPADQLLEAVTLLQAAAKMHGLI